MKIRWKTIYFPLGAWQLEDGTVINMVGNFRATFDAREIIVILTTATAGASHGESALSGLVPLFIDQVTLDQLDNVTWIETTTEGRIE